MGNKTNKKKLKKLEDKIWIMEKAKEDPLLMSCLLIKFEKQPEVLDKVKAYVETFPYEVQKAYQEFVEKVERSDLRHGENLLSFYQRMLI